MAKKAIIKSAEAEVLDSLDELLAENDNALSVPMNAVNMAVSEVVETNAKMLKRLTERILRAADKESVKNDDRLNTVYTNLMNGVDAWMNDAHFLLTQMAVKGGLTAIGAPLETALEKEVTDAPMIQYGATLVLAVKEAVPYLNQLIEVLREIRDRMPPVAVRIKGETPAANAPPDEPEAQNELTAAPNLDDPIDWPEV